MTFTTISGISIAAIFAIILIALNNPLKKVGIQDAIPTIPVIPVIGYHLNAEESGSYRVPPDTTTGTGNTVIGYNKMTAVQAATGTVTHLEK